MKKLVSISARSGLLISLHQIPVLGHPQIRSMVPPCASQSDICHAHPAVIPPDDVYARSTIQRNRSIYIRLEILRQIAFEFIILYERDARTAFLGSMVVEPRIQALVIAVLRRDRRTARLFSAKYPPADHCRSPGMLSGCPDTVDLGRGQTLLQRESRQNAAIAAPADTLHLRGGTTNPCSRHEHFCWQVPFRRKDSDRRQCDQLQLGTSEACAVSRSGRQSFLPVIAQRHHMFDHRDRIDASTVQKIHHGHQANRIALTTGSYGVSLFHGEGKRPRAVLDSLHCTKPCKGRPSMLRNKRILLVIFGRDRCLQEPRTDPPLARGRRLGPVRDDRSRMRIRHPRFRCPALSEDKAYCDLFSLTDESEMGHIRLSREADLLVVAPATANMLAKMAGGICDDLASTVLLATDKDVLVAPAMNVRMWTHPATAANVAQLRSRGIRFAGPAEGPMALRRIRRGADG